MNVRLYAFGADMLTHFITEPTPIKFNRKGVGVVHFEGLVPEQRVDGFVLFNPYGWPVMRSEITSGEKNANLKGEFVLTVEQPIYREYDE